MELTKAQRDAILKIGKPNSVAEVVEPGVIEELLELGLLCRRSSDDRLDFTSLGESEYRKLVRSSRQVED